MDVNTISYITLVALMQGVVCAFFLRSTFRKNLNLDLKYNQLLMSALVGSYLNAALSFFQFTLKLEMLGVEEFGYFEVLFVQLIISCGLQLVGTYFSISQFSPETSVIDKKRLTKMLLIGILKALPIVTILELTFAALLLR
jgi:hypothetical protein